ncbi:MAG: hypothetical protein BGO67_09355 [Alphaproteobacteria bacterium 41-28]|nr:MAG: hypothetical protein BGO67_09355 [Alphaproteobacteria bacterium 41-28]
MFNKYRNFSLALFLSCFVLPCSYAGKDSTPPDEEEKKSSVKRKVGTTNLEENLFQALPHELSVAIISTLVEEKSKEAVKALSSFRRASQHCLEIVDGEVRRALNHREKGLAVAEDYPENLLLPLYYHLNQASIATEPSEVISYYIAAMKLGDGYNNPLATHGLFRFLWKNHFLLEDYVAEGNDFDIVIQNLTCHMNNLLMKWKKEKDNNEKLKTEKNLYKFYLMSKRTSNSEDFQQAYYAFPFAKKQLGDPIMNASASTLWNLWKFYDRNFQDEYALSLLKSAVEKGLAKAQLELAHWRRCGENNPKEAICLFQLAADQGYVKAMFDLGFVYETDESGEKDLAKAAYYYRAGANKGSAMCQDALGRMYIKGEGVEQDMDEAVGLLTSAANQGNTGAQRVLAHLYYYGELFDPNLKKVARIEPNLEKAAHFGHADAQNTLGWFYENGLGVAQSYEKAVEQYQKASQQGHQFGTLNLAYFYRKGLGVPVNIVEATRLEEQVDPDTFAEWKEARAEKANEKGENPSM